VDSHSCGRPHGRLYCSGLGCLVLRPTVQARRAVFDSGERVDGGMSLSWPRPLGHWGIANKVGAMLLEDGEQEKSKHLPCQSRHYTVPISPNCQVRSLSSLRPTRQASCDNGSGFVDLNAGQGASVLATRKPSRPSQSPALALVRLAARKLPGGAVPGAAANDTAATVTRCPGRTI
jgi:hypothetical protein